MKNSAAVGTRESPQEQPGCPPRLGLMEEKLVEERASRPTLLPRSVMQATQRTVFVI